MLMSLCFCFLLYFYLKIYSCILVINQKGAPNYYKVIYPITKNHLKP